MPVDYDLVVIGGGRAARHAARVARQFSARVALVEPPASHLSDREAQQWVCDMLRPLTSDRLPYEESPSEASPTARQARLVASQRWASLVADMQAQTQSLPVLAALGVDTIVGQGEFRRRPRLGFAVNGRVLRARNYLLSEDPQTSIPAIEGAEGLTPLTIHHLLQLDVGDRLLGRHLVVVGTTPHALELSQHLARLGVRITLVVQHSHLLPHADEDAARLIQAQLEADGVQIFRGTSITQVKKLDEQIWLQVGDQAIAADDILFLDTHQPHLDALNLAAVNVKSDGQRIHVNHRLQTHNPHIYAIGEAIAPYAFANVAQFEAELAVHNALFFPNRTVYDQWLPTVMYTHPELASVGMTEAEARQQEGGHLVTVRESFKTLSQAQFRDQTTGFCKLILRPNGDILGAHIVGLHASELIGLFAIAMNQNLKLGAIAQLTYPTRAASEIVNQIILNWRQQRLTRGWRRDVLESIMVMRRNWAR